MVVHHGRFAWYELMTTDIAAARAFYAKVVGWNAQDASAPGLPYTQFTAGQAPVAGLLDLPEGARKMGATPRWMGYVAVDDVAAASAQISRLGGTVYVPPTDTNIGRIAVVADPQTATLALVEGLKPGPRPAAAPEQPGHVGWHELLATDRDRAFAFYSSLFDWRKANADSTPAPDSYQMFAAGEQAIGGIFTKPATAPVPFWLLYFNVDDIDAAVAQVTANGGRVLEGPIGLPDGWIARCVDPQDAMFALLGHRTRGSTATDSAIGWSASWGGISSKGRLVTKRRPL